MARRTIFFIFCLVLLVVTVGYGKYYLLQHYPNLGKKVTYTSPAPQPSPSTQLTPSPIASPSSLSAHLTSAQKIAQLIAYPIELADTKHASAAAQELIQLNPGFIVEGSEPSLAQKKLIDTIFSQSATASAELKSLVLYGNDLSFFPTQHLVASKSAVFTSKNLSASAKEEQLAQDVQQRLINGAQVVIIDPRNKSVHLQNLLTDLIQSYETSVPFSNIVDQAAEQVLHSKAQHQ